MPPYDYTPEDRATLTAALRRLEFIGSSDSAPAPYFKATGMGGKSRVYFIAIPAQPRTKHLVAKFDIPERAAKEWETLRELKNFPEIPGVLFPLRDNDETDGVILCDSAIALVSGKPTTLGDYLLRNFPSNVDRCVVALNRILEPLGVFYREEPGKLALDFNGFVPSWRTLFPKIDDRLTQLEAKESLNGEWPSAHWSSNDSVQLTETCAAPNPFAYSAALLDKPLQDVMLSRIHGDPNLSNFLLSVDDQGDPRTPLVIDLANCKPGLPTAFDLARLETDFWQEVYVPVALKHGLTKELVIETFVELRNHVDGVIPGKIDGQHQELKMAAIQWIKALRDSAFTLLNGGRQNYNMQDYFEALCLHHSRALGLPTVVRDPVKLRIAGAGAALAANERAGGTAGRRDTSVSSRAAEPSILHERVESVDAPNNKDEFKKLVHGLVNRELVKRFEAYVGHRLISVESENLQINKVINKMQFPASYRWLVPVINCTLAALSTAPIDQWTDGRVCTVAAGTFAMSAVAEFRSEKSNKQDLDRVKDIISSEVERQILAARPNVSKELIERLIDSLLTVLHKIVELDGQIANISTWNFEVDARLSKLEDYVFSGALGSGGQWGFLYELMEGMSHNEIIKIVGRCDIDSAELRVGETVAGLALQVRDIVRRRPAGFASLAKVINSILKQRTGFGNDRGPQPDNKSDKAPSSSEPPDGQGQGVTYQAIVRGIRDRLVEFFASLESNEVEELAKCARLAGDKVDGEGLADELVSDRVKLSEYLNALNDRVGHSKVISWRTAVDFIVIIAPLSMTAEALTYIVSEFQRIDKGRHVSLYKADEHHSPIMLAISCGLSVVNPTRAKLKAHAMVLVKGNLQLETGSTEEQSIEVALKLLLSGISPGARKDVDDFDYYTNKLAHDGEPAVLIVSRHEYDSMKLSKLQGILPDLIVAIQDPDQPSAFKITPRRLTALYNDWSQKLEGRQ